MAVVGGGVWVWSRCRREACRWAVDGGEADGGEGEMGGEGLEIGKKKDRATGGRAMTGQERTPRGSARVRSRRKPDSYLDRI